MKLRTWWIQNPPDNPTYTNVMDIDDAIIVLKQFSNNDLNNPNIISNAGGLEIFDNNNIEWSEYYDEDGNNIWEIIENQS